MKELTEAQEYFLEILEKNKGNVKATAADCGYSLKHAYNLAGSLKEEIQDRTRDKLTLATLRAADVLLDGMEADENTVKGELKLKSAESILDRAGVTKHTHMEVQLGESNGLFIIPAKAPVDPEPED